MLDPLIRDAILARLEDTDAGVRRQAIRTVAEHIDDDEKILAALISVVIGDEEKDPDAQYAAYEAVAGLFGSSDQATQAVARALDSTFSTIRDAAARLIVEATKAGDSSAIAILARNLTNHTEEVQTLFTSAARELIDEGRVEDLREQLLLQLESADAAGRILAIDLLGVVGAVHGDLTAENRGSSSGRSSRATDVDAKAASSVPAPEPGLGDKLIEAMRRAGEGVSGEGGTPVRSAEGDTANDGDLAVDGAGGDETPLEPAQHVNPRSVTDLLGELLSSFDERELEILEQRDLTSGERRTLKELGTARGVTRERIRQIEAAAKNKWGGLVRAPQYRPIRDLANRISDELGSAVPASDESVSRAGDNFCGGLASGQRAVAFQLLVEHAGYSQRKGWLVRLSADQEQRLTTAIEELIDQWPIVPRAQLSSLLSKHDIAEQHMEGWCRTFADLRFIAPGALPKRWTLDDLERVLRRRGEPASVKQLLAEAELTDRDERSARQQMSKDRRFTRIDRDGQFAHRDWGFDEHTRIADGIVEELERRGGTAPLGSLCSVLSRRLDVAESSVRAYAAAPIFMKTASGEVTLRPESVPFEFDDNPGTNPACFWHGEHWALRMPVTDDLLRGSGRSIPVQFAAYLGCRPGVNKVFASGSSKVRAVWATTTLGPSLGSVRPALAAKGAEEGDLLFVCYHPGSPDIELRVVKRTPLGSLPVHQRIASELGLHTPIRSLNDVASALSVEHEAVPASIVWREVQEALEARSALDIGGLMAERFPEFAEPSDAADAVDDAAAG